MWIVLVLCALQRRIMCTEKRLFPINLERRRLRVWTSRWYVVSANQVLGRAVQQ